MIRDDYSMQKMWRYTVLMKSYSVAPTVTDDILQNFTGINPVLTQLLVNRGVTDRAEADVFLAPNFEMRHDPFLMTDMGVAVERILRAIRDNERIAIWSDYDCDGVPGGVLAHDFFFAIGYENFENYIPHRHNEGFGLNNEGIDAIAARGAKVIITIDCGIANVREVAHANELSVDVIVTDHHEPGAELPLALAVLDPKRDHAYPFRELCGTGVAWKLVEGLIARGNFALTKGQEKWWLDMVGLATMADMVSLTGENRILAHYGLAVLRKTRRAGMTELFRLLKINPRDLVDDDIGFSIGPRVNAASRMGDPMVAFNAFASRDEGVARQSALALEKVNDERKGTVAAMVKEIKKRLRDRELSDVIVIGDPTWRPSLAGLAANALSEEHRRPAFVWGRDGRGTLKGSARGGATSVIELMNGARDAFIEYGGHHASGGFSVHENSIHTLGDRLVESFRALSGVHVPTAQLIADRELSLEEVTDSFHRTIISLSPFGVGNAKPLFVFCGVIPERVTTFGKANDHTKLTFARRNGTLNAIAFFKTPERFSSPLEAGKSYDLLAHIERSTFMGRPELRLRIVDAFTTQ